MYAAKLLRTFIVMMDFGLERKRKERGVSAWVTPFGSNGK
jgi:hypothetical protein